MFFSCSRSSREIALITTMKTSFVFLALSLLVALHSVAGLRVGKLISKGCGAYNKWVGREAPLLDKDGDGRATRSDVAEYLEMDEQDESLDHIMNSMDVKREGHIDAKDFLASLLLNDEDSEL